MANLHKLNGKRVQLLQLRSELSAWIVHLVGWPTFLLIPSGNLAPASHESFDIRAVVDAQVVSVVFVPDDEGKLLMAAHKDQVTMHATYAKGPIKSLSVVFDEKPLARTEMDATELTGPDWQIFASQYNSHQEEVADEASAAESMARADKISTANKRKFVQEIFSTNAYQVPGTVVLAARLNHSCNNNCSYYWNKEKGLFTIFALRDIIAGEELTVSYTPCTWTRSERQQYLARNKRFICTCPFCGPFIDISSTSAEKAAAEEHKSRIEERDKRLKRIDVMYNLLPSLVNDPDKAATMVENIIKYIEQDDNLELNEKKASACYDMFQIEMQQDGAAENKIILERARKWAERALAFGQLTEPDVSQRDLYAVYAAQPTQFLISKERRNKHKQQKYTTTVAHEKFETKIFKKTTSDNTLIKSEPLEVYPS
eukprot:GILK01015869.1.p1 GENE.GILK01015869.1~~GILK01015869.1.p1  ORF type:complete len:446 (-),score=60.04 GILK01015869.1:112-1395(-)